MKIEDIIKILWRRKFYILLPFIIVPIVSLISTRGIKKEYQTTSLVFIDEGFLQHPYLSELGLKLDLIERLPSIKKMMKSEDSLYFMLDEKPKEHVTAEDLRQLNKKKEAMVIELKGPGVASVSYSGFDPRQVKEITERMGTQFIKYAMFPFRKVGERLKAKLIQRDEIISIQLMPNLIQAKMEYYELNKIYNAQSPDLLLAKYKFEMWSEKVKSREKAAMERVSEIIPLNDDDPDITAITSILEPASLPIEPFKPNRLKIFAIAVVGGLALGFILMFFMEFIDHSMKETGDVENYLESPVLGRIPKIK
jgi:capsular polysaccharide biosynthesis protein